MKTRRFSLDSSVSLSLEGGGFLGAGSSKRSPEGRKIHSLEEADLEVQELGHCFHRCNSLRPQTVEEEMILERPDGVITKSFFVKHNQTFHKLFPDLPAGEDLTHAFTCALQKEVLYHGKLFVAQNYVCFYSSVLLKATKVVIHVSSVQKVKKGQSALSHRLSVITTDGGQYKFKSMRNREVCYKLLQCMCPQAQSANSSPHISSTENGLDQDVDTISSHSSLEDSLEHLDRDHSLLLGTVSSDLTNGASERNSSTPISSISKEKDEQFTVEEDRADSWVWSITERVKSVILLQEIRNLKIVVCIYLLLVVLLLLSSGYIGFKIVALEEQLSSLGALPDLSLPHKDGLFFIGRYKDT